MPLIGKVAPNITQTPKKKSTLLLSKNLIIPTLQQPIES
jgi:hypothetical protein